MRTLNFDLVTFSDDRKRFILQNPDATESMWRKFKQKHFTGSAFNAAFPLSGFPLPLNWSLKGEAILENGDCFEFNWTPEGNKRVTFDDLILVSGEKWADMMEKFTGGQDALSIKCVAMVA